MTQTLVMIADDSWLEKGRDIDPSLQRKPHKNSRHEEVFVKISRAADVQSCFRCMLTLAVRNVACPFIRPPRRDTLV